MSDNKACSSLHKFGKSFLNTLFSSEVDRTCRFIKNKHGRIHQHDSCNADKLFLSLRKTAVLAYNRIVSVWKSFDESVSINRFCSFDNLFTRCLGKTVGNIFRNSSCEDPCILKNHSEIAAQTVSCNIGDIFYRKFQFFRC